MVSVITSSKLVAALAGPEADLAVWVFLRVVKTRYNCTQSLIRLIPPWLTDVLGHTRHVHDSTASRQLSEVKQVPASYKGPI